VKSKNSKTILIQPFRIGKDFATPEEYYQAIQEIENRYSE
jgi:hypothetical protein